MKNFKQFVSEALLPSQFRKYVKAFKKDRYEEIFQDLKAKYSGDRNAYRIYIPLGETTKSELEKEIETFLNDNDIEIIDYAKGDCKHKDAKNISKISKQLTRLNSDLLSYYNIEKAKTGNNNNDDLLACISRHPYDIAGSDTDRDWTNCMTLAHPNSKRVKKLENILDKEPDNYKRETIHKDIKNRSKDGCNVKYLISEVKEGSLISYLIKKDDKNINNPLAVLNIKPYHRDDDENDILLVSCERMYGKHNTEFKKTINDVLTYINKNAKGFYVINKNVYNDGDAYAYDLSIKDPNKTVDSISHMFDGLNDKSDEEIKELKSFLLTKDDELILNTLTYILDNEYDIDAELDDQKSVILLRSKEIRPYTERLYARLDGVNGD